MYRIIWRQLNQGLAITGLALTLALGAPLPGAAASPELEGLEPFISGIVTTQLDQGRIAGATVSVVRDGEIVLAEGYGYADLDERTPVDPERTMFRIGSTSKPVTFTAVMQLAEQGRLDLDADVNEYLDFDIPPVLARGAGEPDPEPITLRHLMTHTPGFEDVGQDLFVLAEEEMLTLEEYLRARLPARVFPAGEVMAYSNYGSALAGYIVERVSGQPFAQYVEENILEPLEMEHSTFRQPLPPELAPHLAGAYSFSGGRYHQGGFEYISGLPAGSMSASGEDMARFMLAHLDEGAYGEERILEPETAREMHSRQFTQHPDTQGMTLGFIESRINGQRVIEHGGATFLFSTGMYLVPEQDVGLFVSYSGGNFLEGALLFQAFMDRYFPGEPAEAPEPAAGSAERAAAYAGEYHPNRANFTTVEKLLGLLQGVGVASDEQGYLLLNYFGYDMSFAEVEPGLYQNVHPDQPNLVDTLAFTEGPDGRTLLAPGGPMTYTRAPWYGSAAFLGSLAALVLLLSGGTAVGWAGAGLQRMLRRKTDTAPRLAFWARVVAAAFALFLLVFLVSAILALADIDPAYGVPRLFYGHTATLLFALALPLPQALLAAGMAVFSGLSWKQGYWTPGARVHYSLYAAAALAWVWFLFYTNLL